jgi:dolichol-phosphate mannosyltransferase
VVDSIAAFSDLPVRLCWVASAALFVISLLMLIAAVAGVPAGGRSVMLILAAVFGVGGLQMTGVAVVGEYAWRAYDEARRRPQYLVEATTSSAAGTRGGGPEEPDAAATAVRG